jgi:hypothetical protein
VAHAATLASARSLMLDTRKQLGGYYIEVAEPITAGPDEQWDPSNEVALPTAVQWLAEIQKIGHFGMAVTSVSEQVPHYAELLGVERWSGVHFNSAPGALEHSTFRGAEVDNAWFLAITDVANFGLELLQETRGPTDYRATVDRTGEAVHHMLVRRDLSADDWFALRDWMASMQIGIVMSGQVRGGATEFFYLDTRDALGFLLEVIVAHNVPAGGAPMRRFDLDFSRHA